MAKSPVPRTPLSGPNSRLADFLVDLALSDELRRAFKEDARGTVEKAKLSPEAAEALLITQPNVAKQAVKRVLATNNQIQANGGLPRGAGGGQKQAKVSLAKKATKKR
jgi:hypothetical protein